LDGRVYQTVSTTNEVNLLGYLGKILQKILKVKLKERREE
jgi:hypothetical protein